MHFFEISCTDINTQNFESVYMDGHGVSVYENAAKDAPMDTDVEGKADVLMTLTE